MQIFSIPTPTTSTNLFLLLFLSLLFILDSMTLNVINRLFLYRHPRMKPTKFHYPPGLSPLILFPPPPTPHRHFDRRTKNIDSRYTFIKVLGLGREGSASVYHDSLSGKKVVIKGFFQGVRKNPLPVHLQKLGGDGKWPAEIPATLYFANANAPGEFETGREERRGKGGFIYAVDYFWVDSWLGGSEWKLVTPFLRFGTLETLAELLKQRGMSPSELDMVYRRRFRGVLVALREMHQAGYTHDDVKMDNIFISATNSFLLGDLGNVREHKHDYHAREDMHTGATDYRQGDTQRAVRSYLSFLRLACGERKWFDSEFHARQEEWSRFYWRYKETGATACELLSSDPFWAEGQGANKNECDEFERGVDEMREQIRQWKAGEGKKPVWYSTGDSGAWGMARESRNVDDELACVCCGTIERILPWKRKLSQSSY